MLYYVVVKINELENEQMANFKICIHNIHL